MIKYHPSNSKPNQPVTYSVIYAQGSVIGHLEMEADGFYYFWPMSHGFWDQRTMMDVARKLEALNEAWSQKISELPPVPPQGDIQRPEDN